MLFSVEKYHGKLHLKNVLIEQFRMRINAIINIREGDVLLENVDFNGIELGNNPGNTGEVPDPNVSYITYGAIIAAPFENSSSGGPPAGSSTNSCGSIFEEIRVPCGRLTWNVGSVTGLNRDVNAFNSNDVLATTYFYGFMDVISLLEINLS